MGWTSQDSFATRLFSGDPWIILLAFAVALTLPVLLHLYFYTTSGRIATSPTILLLGTSGSGKTSLLSFIQKRNADPAAVEGALTRTSQVPARVDLILPPSIPLGSNKYRSKNDVAIVEAEKNGTKYKMIDTPGHGKLRAEQGLSHLQDSSIRGVIFVVDSTAIDAKDAGSLQDTATYLHDALFALQKRKTNTDSKSADLPVLIAANKQDLFTSLPGGAVKDRLQTQIERVRSSRQKGLSTLGEETEDDQEDILGGGGEAKFSFNLMQEEFGIQIDVLEGAVRGDEAGKRVKAWEEWIGGLL